MSDQALESGDSPELEALFNSIALQHAASAPAVPSPAAPQTAAMAEGEKIGPSDAELLNNMYSQIGQLTRKLHDAMHELGYDKSLEKVAEALPDAKDRLAYIASLTESAADKVLNATDIAKPLQDELEAKAKDLGARWEKLHNGQLSVDEFKTLASETRQYMDFIPKTTQATSAQIMEIVMAQDFQDLTGQVIKKVMHMIKSLESELLGFLVQFSPPEKRAELKPAQLDATLLNGPVVNPEGREDVVTNQQQVDDLLESLGF